LVAALAAAQIAPRDLETPHGQTFTLPPVLSEDIQFALAAEDGEVLASTIAGMDVGSDIADAERGAFEASAPIAGALGSVIVSLPDAAIIGSLLQRLAIVLAFVFVVLLVAFHYIWRTRKAATGTTQFDPALDATPHGLARWGADGSLIYANVGFRRLLRIDLCTLCPGTAYDAFSKTIAGKITARPVLDSTQQRIVEVEREDGSAILLDERPCP